jgi:cytosine/uracil/thiamine/allantoin permease
VRLPLLCELAEQAVWNNADLEHSAVSHVIIAAVVALGGFIGSQYHIPFSIASRGSSGFYFPYFGVISRLIPGLIYFGCVGLPASDPRSC